MSDLQCRDAEQEPDPDYPEWSDQLSYWAQVEQDESSNRIRT